MRKITIYSLLIFSSITGVFGQNTEAVTFEQALLIMNDKNYSLKSAASNQRAHEFNRKSTRGLYLPKLSFSASYAKMDEDIGLDVSSFSDAIKTTAQLPAAKMLPSTLVLQKEEFSLASVNVVWPLFNGGKIRSANRLMDARVDEAGYKMEETQNKLNKELVQRYFGFRLSTKAISLYKEAYDAMLLHQNHAQKMEENGMISKAQRLYIDLSVSNAKMDWQKAIKNANTVASALKNTLGDSLNILPVSPLFLIKDIESLAFFQEAALLNNPLLKQVDSKKEMAKQNYNMKRSDYLPSVAIIGNRELYHDDLNEMIPEWFVGVNLSWNLFDGGSRTYKVKSARATMDMVNYIDEKAKSDIQTYVNKLYNELSMHIEQLETMESSYYFANEYLRVQKKAFAEGFATTKDIVDAELTLNKVKIGRVKTMNDYLNSLAQLLEISGKSELFLEYSLRQDRELEDFKAY